MLITFSKPRASDGRTIKIAVEFAREALGRPIDLEIKWATDTEVRFTLPGADNEAHEEVIKTLLEMDHDAKIRTARAVYEGLADYQAQLAARVP